MMLQAADPWKRVMHAALRRAVDAIKDPEEVEKDLASAQDPVTCQLAQALETAAANIGREYQRDTVLRLGRFGLWWLDKDDAYRDFRNAIVRELLRRREVLERVTPDKPPSEWWVNMFHDAEARGNMSRAVGSVPEASMTVEEAAFFSEPAPEGDDQQG